MPEMSESERFPRRTIYDIKNPILLWGTIKDKKKIHCPTFGTPIKKEPAEVFFRWKSVKKLLKYEQKSGNTFRNVET